MTDTTNLGTITVVGQRRQADGSFPSGGGGGGGGELDVPVRLRDPLEPPLDPLPYYIDPCASPATSLPWNADAAGARSADAFVSKAAGVGDTNPQTGLPTLANREFGRGLAHGPDGSIWGNAVTPGPDRDPNNPTSSMTINWMGLAIRIISETHTAIPTEMSSQAKRIGTGSFSTITRRGGLLDGHLKRSTCTS